MFLWLFHNFVVAASDMFFLNHFVSIDWNSWWNMSPNKISLFFVSQVTIQLYFPMTSNVKHLSENKCQLWNKNQEFLIETLDETWALTKSLCSLFHGLQFSFIYNDVKHETRACI